MFCLSVANRYSVEFLARFRVGSLKYVVKKGKMPMLAAEEDSGLPASITAVRKKKGKTDELPLVGSRDRSRSALWTTP